MTYDLLLMCSLFDQIGIACENRATLCCQFRWWQSGKHSAFSLHNMVHPTTFITFLRSHKQAAFGNGVDHTLIHLDVRHFIVKWSVSKIKLKSYRNTVGFIFRDALFSLYLDVR